MKNARMWLVVCVLSGCVGVPGGPINEGILVHEVTYDLAWTLQDIDFVPYENNLGFQVTVDTAYIVHYAIQLVPCTDERSATAVLWAPWTAIAGHGDENDVSVTQIPVVEGLHKQQSLSLGTVSFTPQRYCGVHYLVGRASASAEGLPTDVSLTDRSLYVRGEWQRGTGPQTPFEWETDLAYGAFQALPSDTPSGAIRWVGTRRPERLFQDVHFENMSQTQQMWQFLINAVDGVDVGIESSE